MSTAKWQNIADSRKIFAQETDLAPYFEILAKVKNFEIKKPFMHHMSKLFEFVL
jgi:hypothetical protein